MCSGVIDVMGGHVMQLGWLRILHRRHSSSPGPVSRLRVWGGVLACIHTVKLCMLYCGPQEDRDTELTYRSPNNFVCAAAPLIEEVGHSCT